MRGSINRTAFFVSILGGQPSEPIVLVSPMQVSQIKHVLFNKQALVNGQMRSKTTLPGCFLVG